MDLERDATQHRVAAPEIAERHVVELHVTADAAERFRVRPVFDLISGVENLEDPLGGGGRLRHQVDDEAELTHRQEHVGQVEAELLPFADGERPSDDLPATEVQHRGLPEIGDQEHDGKQERERPRHLQLLGQQCVGGAAEAHLFLWLAAESAHHLESGDVLLQDRVERTDAHLDGHEERLRDRAEEQEHAKCDGQDGQDDQGEGRIAEPQHEQRGDQQDERLEREDQALADEEAHFLDVVRGADHQLAGLGAIQIAERQALDSGEQLVAKIEGDVLGDALGVVLLAKGEHSANGTEDDDRDHRAKERLDG